jgi:hypothetical protein
LIESDKEFKVSCPKVEKPVYNQEMIEAFNYASSMQFINVNSIEDAQFYNNISR